MDLPDIDPNFEPQIRARSNTWPVRPKDIGNEENSQETPSVSITTTDNDNEGEAGDKLSDQGFLNSKKPGGSRRNAWGNLSYADLITKAIQSSPEQRLTLSQIYDWMVQNVPYFRDKGDSNSSAGWKNSIRHNLSLHSRFMRVQNEGTGKSSWWVLNPDAKPGKTPRRRATSMDTKAYEKKRGRVKKKVEALRAAMAGDNLSETGSCYGGSAQELNLLDNYNLSPQDFRQRTSSNASSMGRLSPIQSALEVDLHDNQVPPMSPLPWLQNVNAGSYNTGAEGAFDQSLSESLAEMFVNDNNLDIPENGTFMRRNNLSPNMPQRQQQQQQQMTHSPTYRGGQNQSGYGGGYSDQLHSPQPSQMLSVNHMSPNNVLSPHSPVGMDQSNKDVRTLPGQLGGGGGGGGDVGSQYNTPQTLSELLETDNPIQQPSFLRQVDQVMSSPPPASTLNQYSGYNMQLDNTAAQSRQTPTNNLSSSTSPPAPQPSAAEPAVAGLPSGGPLGINDSLLRQALTTNSPINIKHANRSMQGQLSQLHQQQHQQQGEGMIGGLTDMNLKQQFLANNTMTGQTTIQQPQLMAGGTMVTNPSLPSDIDMTLTADFSGCDVDQILNHELAFDDNLDFNFDPASDPADDRALALGNAQDIFGSLKT